MTVILGMTAVLFMLAAVFSLTSREANAYHPNNPPIHLTVQHFATAPEEFCVWVEDGSTTHSTAFTTIRDILYVNNPTEDWNNLAWDASAGNWRIAWSAIDGNPCYPSQWGAYFDVQYRVRADQSVNGCGSVNCVAHYNPTWNAAWGHYDYGLGIAFMRTNNLYPHAINHETGHILGLADPATFGSCPSGGSIMHSRYYGCSTDYAYPTYNDRYNVEYISTYPWP